MVHESLRKLARLTQIPEALVGVGKEESTKTQYIKRKSSLSQIDVDPARVIESDLLRWLYLLSNDCPRLFALIKKNLQPKHFSISICRRLFSHYMEQINEGKVIDLSVLAQNLEGPEEQLLFSEIIQKKVNKERAEEGIIEVTTKILQSFWMREREAITKQIQSGRLLDSEMSELAKKFDSLTAKPPCVVFPPELE